MEFILFPFLTHTYYFLLVTTEGFHFRDMKGERGEKGEKGARGPKVSRQPLPLLITVVDEYDFSCNNRQLLQPIQLS